MFIDSHPKFPFLVVVSICTLEHPQIASLISKSVYKTCILRSLNIQSFSGQALFCMYLQQNHQCI